MNLREAEWSAVDVASKFDEPRWCHEGRLVRHVRCYYRRNVRKHNRKIIRGKKRLIKRAGESAWILPMPFVVLSLLRELINGNNQRLVTLTMNFTTVIKIKRSVRDFI